MARPYPDSFLIGLLITFSSLSFADRTIDAPVGPAFTAAASQKLLIDCRISNPSGVAQTIDFHAYRLDNPALELTGFPKLAVSIPQNTHYEARISLNNGQVVSDVSALIKIVVAGDDGFLVGQCTAEYYRTGSDLWHSLASYPINGGRPF